MQAGVGVEFVGWFEEFDGEGDICRSTCRIVFCFVMTAKCRGLKTCEFGKTTGCTWMELMQLMSGGGKTTIIRLLQTSGMGEQVFAEGGARCKRVGRRTETPGNGAL